MRRILSTFSVIALLAPAACSTNPPPDDVARSTPSDSPGRTVDSASGDIVSGVGTIVFIDLEGGFYGLVAQDGTQYDPLNLDEAFQQDSLAVRFRARRRTDVMTIRMWGRPVEILEIERVE